MTLRPEDSVRQPILECFGQMFHLDRGAADEIGDRPRRSAVIVGNVLACVGGLPFARPLSDAPAAEWATLVYLGVVPIGLAYVCLTRAMGHLPALEVSLLLLLEPVLNPMWTWFVRGENPGAWTLAGGALIGNRADWNGRHLHDQVEPVAQRTGQPPAVARNLQRRTPAFAPFVARKPARTSPRCLFAIRSFDRS